MNLNKNIKLLIKRDLKKNDKIMLVFLVILLVFVLGSLLVETKGLKLVKFFESINKSKNITEEIPSLKLPIKYFDENLISSGSYADTDINGSMIFSSALIDEGYRSFPTIHVTLDKEGYSNSIYNIPQLEEVERDMEEIKSIEDDKFIASLEEFKEENIKEYGPLAARFFPDDYIVELKEFDVDNDGKKEKIVSLCGVWGNHCPHRIVIIKGEKIIFTGSEGIGGLDIQDTNTGNGFYMTWTLNKNDGSIWDAGFCCPPGYIRTRFVYEDKIFRPVYEQTFLFVKVDDPKY